LLLDRSRAYSCETEQREAADRQKVNTDGDGNSESEDGDETECIKYEREGASSEGLPVMYKALDGSALVAIGGLIVAKFTRRKLNRSSLGMLLQEFVSALLKPNVPPGWEEEMEAAGLAPSDENSSQGNETTEETQSNKSEDDETWDRLSVDDKD